MITVLNCEFVQNVGDGNRAVPGAGIYAGPGWFSSLTEMAHAAVPEARFSPILDCGDDAGAALAAMRAGIERIIFTGSSDVGQRLAEIGVQCETSIMAVRPKPDLDLADHFFADEQTLRQRCAEVLALVTRFC